MEQTTGTVDTKNNRPTDQRDTRYRTVQRTTSVREANPAAVPRGACLARPAPFFARHPRLSALLTTLAALVPVAAMTALVFLTNPVAAGSVPRRALAVNHDEQEEDLSLLPWEQRGEKLFARFACFTCHGAEGKGGIANPGYVKETVPALNLLAERLMLFEPEDVDAFTRLLEEQRDLDTWPGEAPVPAFPAVVAQHHAVREVILNGSIAGQAEDSPTPPPLNMPSFRGALDELDIDALLVYLLRQYPWEE